MSDPKFMSFSGYTEETLEKPAKEFCEKILNGGTISAAEMVFPDSDNGKFMLFFSLDSDIVVEVSVDVDRGEMEFQSYTYVD